MFDIDGARFAAKYRDRPTELRSAATHLLIRLGMVRVIDDGWMVRAVAARFAVDVRRVNDVPDELGTLF